jgi:hypothetical protein
VKATASKNCCCPAANNAKLSVDSRWQAKISQKILN